MQCVFVYRCQFFDLQLVVLNVESLMNYYMLILFRKYCQYLFDIQFGYISFGNVVYEANLYLQKHMYSKHCIGYYTVPATSTLPLL